MVTILSHDLKGQLYIKWSTVPPVFSLEINKLREVELGTSNAMKVIYSFLIENKMPETQLAGNVHKW